jgi:hypothetical protein
MLQCRLYDVVLWWKYQGKVFRWTRKGEKCKKNDLLDALSQLWIKKSVNIPDLSPWGDSIMLYCKSFLSKTMRFNLEADCELKLNCYPHVSLVLGSYVTFFYFILDISFVKFIIFRSCFLMKWIKIYVFLIWWNDIWRQLKLFHFKKWF